MTNERPLILITNDDGVAAKGINELAACLRDLGDIVVFAPDGPRSGMSSAITSTLPIKYSLRRKEEGLTVYSCTGTPVDCVKLALNEVLDRMPDLLVSYAPTVLLIILAVTLLSGIISLVLGFVIAIANPFLGAMYTFFFSNCVGKQLSKAVFTSVILCCIVYLLGYFGYTVICISASALAAYIPLLIVLLLLWYLIGHTL